MKVNWPNYVTFPSRQIMYGALALWCGYFLYVYSNSVVMGLALGIFILISGLYIHSHIECVKFSQHISKYGEKVRADNFNKHEESSVLGTVPFGRNCIVCTSYIEERGIVVESQRTNRLIPWAEIKNIKHLSFHGHPVVELSIHNLELKNRLIVPWSRELDAYIPSEISQYYS